MSHLGADGAKLIHDLAVHGTDIASAATGDFGKRHLADEGFFDTKTFAMNRHETVPDLYSSQVLSRCNLTRGSHRIFQLSRNALVRTSAINHGPAVFIENKRYPTIPGLLATW